MVETLWVSIYMIHKDNDMNYCRENDQIHLQDFLSKKRMKSYSAMSLSFNSLID